MSQRELSGAYLDAEGKWGRMEAARWDMYLDWLSEEGLLTTFTQSRTPREGARSAFKAAGGAFKAAGGGFRAAGGGFRAAEVGFRATRVV
eukprot:1915860-Pyramimonas_sp.AAC.1